MMPNDAHEDPDKLTPAWIAGISAALTLILVATGGMILWGLLNETPPTEAAAFQVMVIKPGNFLAEQVAEATAAGGRVPPSQIDFQAEVATFKVEDVAKASHGVDFLGLLTKAGIDAKTPGDVVILRSRDGEHITATDGDALSNANMSVIVLSREILKMFDDERSAFQNIRLRISGLQ